MRITNVTHVPTDTLGGTQVVAGWLGNLLESRGHMVENVSLPLSGPSKNPIFYSVIGNILHTRAVCNAAEAKRDSTDFYICHVPAGLLDGPGINIFHLDLYHHMTENFPVWHPNHWRLKAFEIAREQSCGRRGRKNIALSRKQAAGLSCLGIRVDEIIPNPVDTAKFIPASDKAAAKERLGLPSETASVLVVARPSRVKRLPMFMRIAEALPKVQFIIAGPSRKFFPSAPQNIRFLGAVPSGGMVEVYQAADIYLSVSACESFGLALAEAMACGLPFVSTPVGLASDIFEKHDLFSRGKIHRPGDAVPVIAQMMKECTLMAELGLAGRQLVTREASAQLVSERYLQLLPTSVSPHGGPALP